MTWILAVVLLQSGAIASNAESGLKRFSLEIQQEDAWAGRIQVSAGGAWHVGNNILEGYKTWWLEGRYSLYRSWDLGLRVERTTQTEPFELPEAIELLDPSGEIDSEGSVTILSLFGNFHPWGRELVVDPYVGAGLTVFFLDGEDVTRTIYDVQVDTPPAIALTLKIGATVYITRNLGLTAEVGYSLVMSDYTIKDRIGGLTEDFNLTQDVSMSIGIGWTF